MKKNNIPPAYQNQVINEIMEKDWWVARKSPTIYCGQTKSGFTYTNGGSLNHVLAHIKALKPTAVGRELSHVPSEYVVEDLFGIKLY